MVHFFEKKLNCFYNEKIKKNIKLSNSIADILYSVMGGDNVPSSKPASQRETQEIEVVNAMVGAKQAKLRNALNSEPPRFSQALLDLYRIV